MKSSLLFALGMAAFFLGFSPFIKADDWKTTDGKVYQNVTVIKTEPDAVTIIYQDGGALLPLVKLPPNLQKRFNYDPVKAKAAAEARAQSEAQNTVALQSEMTKTRDQRKNDLIAMDPRTQRLAATNAALPSYRGSPSYKATTTFDPMGQPTTTTDGSQFTPNTETLSSSEDKMSDPVAEPDPSDASAPVEPATQSVEPHSTRMVFDGLPASTKSPTPAKKPISTIEHHSTSDLVDINSRLKDDHPSLNKHTASSLLFTNDYLMPDPLDPYHHSTDDLLNSASPQAPAK